MPANKFVAGFIGTPQMNFFEGTLKKMGEEVEVKFNGSDSVVKIPYGMLVKVMPQYLDGKTPVYIGLRADDITIDPDDVKESSTTIKVKISHTEELGTETLVYSADEIEGTAVIRGNRAHMANLAVYASKSVNGVAKLHTEIIERDVFPTEYKYHPEKF